MTGDGEDNRDRVMVDIETLGIEPGAAILSIGAVEFDADGYGEEFYDEISIQSCQAAGLSIDAETLAWWLDQEGAVSDILTGGKPLGQVLEAFCDWFPEGAEVWANAPSFDCEHLEVAFEAAGLEEPWRYDDERDVRTLRNIPCAVEMEQDGREHHALDDARYQARIVSRTLAALRAHEMATEHGGFPSDWVSGRTQSAHTAAEQLERVATAAEPGLHNKELAAIERVAAYLRGEIDDPTVEGSA